MTDDKPTHYHDPTDKVVRDCVACLEQEKIDKNTIHGKTD